MSKTTANKYKKLYLGLLFDGIGALSLALPFIGDFADVIWAPVAGWLMTRMYRGKAGQAAGFITFLEEIVPGLDIIPTFTLMWLYTYVLKGAKRGRVIEVD
ncbi:hypothetical protein FK220_012750 [Flavobacteriaceae bacterium TP-CH-4]|uniref:Uncharacterized protein n=1 Tax=Pelagihabitans pacificus TaxID=2696054 RepID=A0A967ATQ6_9FLAO|nr:hypothetical protein [Pelagihabitans pacificus]NHF60216.1 hypothetical protein [Pelagihabitans pacificus]